uniref:CSON010134 protein n=1 Tax=Culicoides sonorensis TaxID=179676 RepID=A0A336K140_CULSO
MENEKDETSHNKTVETTVASIYFTPQSNIPDVSDNSINRSKVDENICLLNESEEKFDVTASTALVDEVCTRTHETTRDRNICDISGGCSSVGEGSESFIVNESRDKNQIHLLSDNNNFYLEQNRKKNKTKFCTCTVYDKMSEADTEYLDFTPIGSPLKCSNFDENCFCQHSDDMSSLSMNGSTSSSGVNVIKRQYNTNRRMIKIRIKTKANNECSVEGESTENGIKICISPRQKEAKVKNKRNTITKSALNETYSITSSRTISEIDASSLETDFEFRKNLKNELKRSPAAVKVLNYLESLSEAKKISPDKINQSKRKSRKSRSSDPKAITENVPFTKTSHHNHETKNRRSKSKTPPKRAPTPQSITSVDDEEFHDCCDKTVLSTSVTGSSEYEDTTEFDTSQGLDNNVNDKEKPLITITQEMTAEMVVTSKFEINKAKLKRLSENRERRKSKESRGSPEKIIDDNFCNEILDKINQFQNNYDENANETDDSIDKPPLDTTTDISNISNTSLGPEKPPRTFAYRRSQDNAARPVRENEMRSSLESLDMYLYEEMKRLKLYTFNQSRKSQQQISPVMDESNYVVGGWKISPNHQNLSPIEEKSTHESSSSKIGWTTSPRTEAGWIREPQPPIPDNIVNMLHYSDDENKKINILSSNSRAQPQQMYPSSSSKPSQMILGPKIDIDTVDAAISHTPPSSSSNQRFEEFANNTRARSTPRRTPNFNETKSLPKKLEPYLKFKRTKSICKKFLEMERNGEVPNKKNKIKTNQVIPLTEVFLQNEREDRKICKKCCGEIKKKSPKFHQKAFKRTKTLFAASKKKIGVLKEKVDRKYSSKSVSEILSDSDPYCTPENGNTPCKPEIPKRRSSISLHDNSVETIDIQDKVLPMIPDHQNNNYPNPQIIVKQPSFNYNAPLPQSPQRPLLEVTPTKKMHMKINLSPKRFFGLGHVDASTSTPTSPIQIPKQGGYTSFEDREQNLAATMGEILSQLRTLVEGYPLQHEKKVSVRQDRELSTSSEILNQDHTNDANKRFSVNAVLHNQSQYSHEPDYAEILQNQQVQSPSKIKTQHHQFSPPQIQRIEKNNNEYIIVNNDPRAIYATVVKKSKSLNNLTHTSAHNKKKGLDVDSSPSVQKPYNSVNNTPTKPIRTRKKSSRRRITFNVQQQPSTSNTITQKEDHSVAVRSQSQSDENIVRYLKLSNSCGSLQDNNDMEGGKNISKNLFGSDQCVKVSAKVYDLEFARKYRVAHEKYQKRANDDANFAKEVKQIEYDTNIMDQYLESLTNILNKKVIVDDKNIKKATEDFLLKEIDVERNDNVQRNDSQPESKEDFKICQGSDHLSTGGTYKSYGFPRPDAKRTDDVEESFSLNYSSGDTDSHNNEAGYDVVDFKPYQNPVMIRTNTIEECICEAEFEQYFNSDEKRQVTSLDDTLTTESQTNSSGSNSEVNSAQASPVKPPRRGSIYRSFKNSLRTSFRKGRDFIKHEQDKLVQLFDKSTVIDGKNALPKPARSFVNLDEYKKYYNDQNAELIYKNWSEKLAQTESYTDSYQKRMLELINQITAQRQIKKQLRNALEICRSSKEFDSSSELIEAERLLLVSNLKEAASKKELMTMENDLYSNIRETTNNIGMIALSDFEFPLKDAAMYDTLFNYFYVVVATYKDQVKASYAKERQGNKVSFRGFEFKFWEVEPEYQIKIEVFVLCLRKNNRGATESRLNSTKNAIKMSPRRFFGGGSSSGSPSKDKSPRYDPDLEFSQFKSQGFLFVTSSSFVSYSESIGRRQIPDANIELPYYSSSNFNQYLKKSGDHYINCVEDYRTFRMNQMIYNSHLTGQLEMAIKSELVFDGSNMSGFLTIGESINGTITWNRRWCKVDGLCLNFWNYPQETNTKPPIEIIDISKCENDYIYQADRAICPRPRAIVIEQADSSTSIEAKPGYYFLVTDNKQELKDWLRELNKILRFVRDWKL